MTITAINAAALTMLRGEIDAALKALGEKHGITLRAGNGKYDGESIGSFKLDICLPSSTGETNPALVKAERDWKAYAAEFDLQPEWLGKSFGRAKNGGVVTIVGLMPNRHKFPVLVRSNGKADVLLTVGEVRVAFGLPREPVQQDLATLRAKAIAAVKAHQAAQGR